MAIVLVLGLTTALGCSINAERDNPLDPSSPRYTALIGVVRDRAWEPIPGVQVTVLPENRMSVTDGAGEYCIPGLSEGVHTARASASPYEPDSHSFEISRGQTVSEHFQLNGLPYFEWISSVSAHEPIWPLEVYYAELAAIADDPDGSPDVESLWIEIPDVGYRRRMEFDHSTGCFRHTITPDSFPGGNMHELVGKDILFRVADRQKSESQQVSRVTRLVDPLPEIVSPAYGENVGALPTLRWQFSSQFTVTYSIRIHSTQPPGLVWSSDSIPQSMDSVQVSDSLAAGPHYWTVAAIDEYGNWARSEEASFVVE